MEARDGSVREILCSAVPLRDSSGEIFGAVCTGTDVTAQLATERRLRELTARLETQVSEAVADRKILADVVEATDALVQVIGRDFRWLAINKAAVDEYERLLGIRPKPGDSLLDVLAPFPDRRPEMEALWSRALEGEEFTEQITIGPEPRHFEMKFSPLMNEDGKRIGAYQFVHDITDRIQSQARLAEAREQLHEMQKLDMIGQLTGNVAHDFNNLLTPIVGTLELLRRSVPDERGQRLTSAALQAADRARTLVQRLLAFARRQHLQARPVAIDRLIGDLADLIKRSVGPTVRLETEIAAGLPAAQIDPNQLELALLNLAVNARDAMPEGGTLRITADRDNVTGHPQLQSGDYIRISVIDSGLGMDPETLRRAVEPFFTTKGAEKGTGLGLSMVHGLAAQSGGDFALTSSPGKGTTATIWLPVSTEPDAQRNVERTNVHAVAEQTGTILLVDDEPLVRAATAGMLQDAGFTVFEAESGAKAVDLVSQGVKFDALVTDYAMPGMSGVKLARWLRERDPELPVLLITGYASVEDTDAGGLPRLSKPFRQQELAASLADLLDRSRAT
jgi:signal transduction histidine kinase